MIATIYELLAKAGITKGQDKILHAVAGLVITLVVGLLFGIVYGLISGAVAGVLKEAHDEYDYYGADFFDFFATLIGVFLGGAIVVAFT